MASLADLKAWRDVLMKARFTGERVVQYGDTRLEYKTEAEMRDALAALDREISQLSGSGVRDVRVYTTKGL